MKSFVTSPLKRVSLGIALLAAIVVFGAAHAVGLVSVARNSSRNGALARMRAAVDPWQDVGGPGSIAAFDLNIGCTFEDAAEEDPPERCIGSYLPDE